MLTHRCFSSLFQACLLACLDAIALDAGGRGHHVLSRAERGDGHKVAGHRDLEEGRGCATAGCESGGASSAEEVHRAQSSSYVE